MKILVVVAEQSEVQPMKRLLAQAGVQADVTFLLKPIKAKPSMKELRVLKPLFDVMLERDSFDVIVAAGETAARMVLDTSAVNINKLRGRDFEYVYGVRKPGKKVQAQTPDEVTPTEEMPEL